MTSDLCLVYWGSHGCSMPRGHHATLGHVCGTDELPEDEDGPCSRIDWDQDEGVWVQQFGNVDGTFGPDRFPVTPYGDDLAPPADRERVDAVRQRWQDEGKMAVFENGHWVKRVRDSETRRQELVNRIREDVESLSRPLRPLTEADARAIVERYDQPDPPKPVAYGLFQIIGPQMVPYGPSREPALPDDLPTDPAERLMAIMMLRAARYAPRGGLIRFSAIDKDETGAHVVRQASIPTEDARRLTGLSHREKEKTDDDDEPRPE